VADLLRHDPQLVRPADSSFAGRLTFPYGYGMVLGDITHLQFETSGWVEFMQPHLVICKDEMTESADAEVFQSRLWGMFNVRFESKLTLAQEAIARSLGAGHRVIHGVARSPRG
jgi:hypothetical protein